MQSKRRTTDLIQFKFNRTVRLIAQPPIRRNGGEGNSARSVFSIESCGDLWRNLAPRYRTAFALRRTRCFFLPSFLSLPFDCFFFLSPRSHVNRNVCNNNRASVWFAHSPCVSERHLGRVVRVGCADHRAQGDEGWHRVMSPHHPSRTVIISQRNVWPDGERDEDRLYRDERDLDRRVCRIKRYLYICNSDCLLACLLACFFVSFHFFVFVKKSRGKKFVDRSLEIFRCALACAVTTWTRLREENCGPERGESRETRDWQNSVGPWRRKGWCTKKFGAGRKRSACARRDAHATRRRAPIKRIECYEFDWRASLIYT